MAQRLFPVRIIDIYWKKYQRLYLAKGRHFLKQYIANKKAHR
jgi:hypothetical protein